MRFLVTFILLSLSSLSYAEWADDYPAGSTFPDFKSSDQFGEQKQLSQLMGKNGMVIFFNRSTSW